MFWEFGILCKISLDLESSRVFKVEGMLWVVCSGLLRCGECAEEEAIY